MTIKTEQNGKTGVIFFLSGRLDTANSPLLERKLKQWGDKKNEITLDFLDLGYISSMGLRVLLHAHKTFMEKNKKMIIKNMNESIREVFEMTGFIKLLDLA
ncbi:MAG: STAS domain-containing protein [Treponema sp.]|nr:STAS domain-containing protein [Treponema sp.]